MSEISVELGNVTIGGGTGDFEELENRPKYNGTLMTGSTDIPEVPDALSDLASDTTHRLVTDAEKAAWNAKADADDIPTELSELNGDTTHRTVTDAEKAAWNAKAETSAIPTKTSQLTNDSGYLTQHQDISGKVDKTTTVNGQALSSNVLLDGDDINVDESAETKQTIKAALTAQSSQIEELDSLYDANVDVGTITNGYYIHANSGAAETQGAVATAVTGFIEVESGREYKATKVRLVGNASVCGYDSEKSFVESFGDHSDSTELEITVPNGVSYIRMTSLENITPILKYIDKPISKDINTLTAAVKTDTIISAINSYKEYTGSKLNVKGCSSGKILIKSITSGSTYCQIDVRGKNLLKLTCSSETKTGVTLTVNSNGTLTLSGTATAYTFFNIMYRGQNDLWGLIPGETYTIFMHNTASNLQHAVFAYYDSDWHQIYDNTNAEQKFTVPSNATGIFARILCQSGDAFGTGFTIYPQIERGVKQTDFLKYQENSVIVKVSDTPNFELESYDECVNIDAGSNTLNILVPFSTGVSGSIAKEANRKISVLGTKSRDVGPIVTFMDDDTSTLASVQAYYNMCVNNGVKGDFVSLMYYLGQDASLLASLRTYELAGFGIILHGHTQNICYRNDSNRNISLCEDLLVQGIREANSYGFKTDLWCPPYGVYDDDIQALARKYGFKALIASIDFFKGYNTIDYIEKYRIRRAELWGENYTESTYTYDMLKSDINKCADEKGWICITTHANTWDNDISTRFAEIVSILNTKNFKFMNFREALSYYEPIYDLYEAF